MQRPRQQTISVPIPAAQYVRMSDKQQQYSIDNQKAAIRQYADAHGFAIVKTYADEDKSRAHSEALEPEHIATRQMRYRIIFPCRNSRRRVRNGATANP